MSDAILLIEDNEQNRYLVTFLLERHGHRVIHAPDGPSGVEAARASGPSLVLLDIQLPGMSGYEVARALRSIPGVGATPIVAVTSYAMLGDREKALESGCTGYIEKPINPDTFVAEVERYLRPLAPPAEGGEP